MPDSPESNIYQLRAVLLGISPIIWRCLTRQRRFTIADLHDHPTNRLLAGPVTIFTASLFMANNTALLTSAGSLFVMTPRRIKLSDLAYASRKFPLRIRFNDQWRHLIRVKHSAVGPISFSGLHKRQAGNSA